MKKPKAPKPTSGELALRARQVADLTKLDEEENRRIKALFRGRSGGRAFRSAGRSGSAAGAASGAGGGYSGGGGSYVGGSRGGTRSVLP